MKKKSHYRKQSIVCYQEKMAQKQYERLRRISYKKVLYIRSLIQGNTFYLNLSEYITTRLSPGHASVTQPRSTNRNTQHEGKITVITLSFNKHSGRNFTVFCSSSSLERKLRKESKYFFEKTKATMVNAVGCL